MMMRVKNHHTLVTIRPDTDLRWEEVRPIRKLSILKIMNTVVIIRNDGRKDVSNGRDGENGEW